jgi:hypothetical protein
MTFMHSIPTYVEPPVGIWLTLVNEPKLGLDNRRKGSLEARPSRSGSLCP